jgi:hypothetical protein
MIHLPAIDWRPAVATEVPSGADDPANAMQFLCRDSDGNLHVAHQILNCGGRPRFYTWALTAKQSRLRRLNYIEVFAQLEE